MYTLAEAAEATGKSKSTLLRSIKSSKLESLSATKDGDGKYQIDPAELHRIYPPVSDVARHDAVRDARHDAPRNTPDARHDAGEINVLQTKLEAAEQLAAEREKELHSRDRTIDDLRTRLDTESEERRKLTMMLTDQRTTPQPAPDKPAERPKTHAGMIWALVIVLAVLAVMLLQLSGNLNLSGV